MTTSRWDPRTAALLLLLAGCASPTDEPVLTFRESLAAAGQAEDAETFTRQDRLRGSITPERAWWDVLHYDLTLRVFPEERMIEGTNTLTFQVLQPGQRLQLDLQPPLSVTRVTAGALDLHFERDGNVYWVDFPAPLEAGGEHQVTVHYGGAPLVSERPPWSGGFTWDEDELGRPFIATTCQGIGASVWWPNKDHGADEPDRGMDIHATVPADLVAVSNGRLVQRTTDPDASTSTFHWRVVNPINNYGVNLNIGHYVSWSASFPGEAGPLDVEHWVLDYQRELAERQFQEVPRTLAAFEHWFGPYPFYEDSFKIVVVPYLGMEHQSSVTYGNGFQNGYRGRDLSASGVGLKFDFIVVHEAAHEWWGNNISMQDAADMWIHESFANYAENLFVEYHFTEAEAQTYVIGCRKLIRNDRPVIGTYGVNAEGSGDMYYKGGNMLHTMRHILADDARWREVLRGLNRDFRHQTVHTEQVERYISRVAGFDFSKVFDQYLRTTWIPVLRHAAEGDRVRLWFENVVPGFRVPVVVLLNGARHRLPVSETPREVELNGPFESIELDRNFYMTLAAEDAEQPES